MRLLLVVLVLLGFASFPGAAGALTLSQPAGRSGCVHYLGGDGCAKFRGTEWGEEAVVSPDGRNVYLASGLLEDGGLATFTRDRRTGALKPLPGDAGCFCRGSFGDVAVAADGLTVYAVLAGKNPWEQGLRVYRRDPGSGRLTEQQCFSPSAEVDGCTPAALQAPGALALSGATLLVGGESLSTFALGPDGLVVGAGTCVMRLGPNTEEEENLCTGAPYVSRLLPIERMEVTRDGRRLYANGSGHVQAYDLGPSGPVFAACVGRSAGRPRCRPARAVDGMKDLAVAPDGKAVYTAAAAFFTTDDIGLEGVTGNSNVGTFTTGGGRLAQLSGPRGCTLFATENGKNPGCQPGPRSRGDGFLGASVVEVTPDGSHVLAGFEDSTAVVLLRRNRLTQALTPVSGRGGCIVDRESDAIPGCARGGGIGNVRDVAVAPDGRNAYVVSGAGLAVLRLR